jgi:hypothetical protein
MRKHFYNFHVIYIYLNLLYPVPNYDCIEAHTYACLGYHFRLLETKQACYGEAYFIPNMYVELCIRTVY